MLVKAHGLALTLFLCGRQVAGAEGEDSGKGLAGKSPRRGHPYQSPPSPSSGSSPHLDPWYVPLAPVI